MGLFGKDTKKIPNDERMSAKNRLRLAQIAFLPSEEKFDVVKLVDYALGFMIYWDLPVSTRIKLPTTKKVQVGAGTLSGLMGGFFGMQGPPAVLYFIQSEPTKEHYMAMAQTYFLIGNVMMTGVRAYNGFFTTTVAVDYLYGLGGVIIGTIFGAYVFKHIPNRIFRYIVYAYICISGVIILMTN